jgi:predicted metalloendopeptidase
VNIADIRGVKVANAALLWALAGMRQEKIDGFTTDQRFFLGFRKFGARFSAMKIQAEAKHRSPSPARYCVNGVARFGGFSESV